MENNRHTPEQIVHKLRQVDVLVGQWMQRVDAIRDVRIDVEAIGQTVSTCVKLRRDIEL